MAAGPKKPCRKQAIFLHSARPISLPLCFVGVVWWNLVSNNTSTSPIFKTMLATGLCFITTGLLTCWVEFNGPWWGRIGIWVPLGCRNIQHASYNRVSEHWANTSTSEHWANTSTSTCCGQSWVHLFKIIFDRAATAVLRTMVAPIPATKW